MTLLDEIERKKEEKNQRFLCCLSESGFFSSSLLMFSKIHKILGDYSSTQSFNKSKYILLFYKYHSGLISNFKAPISSKVLQSSSVFFFCSFLYISSKKVSDK